MDSLDVLPKTFLFTIMSNSGYAGGKAKPLPRPRRKCALAVASVLRDSVAFLQAYQRTDIALFVIFAIDSLLHHRSFLALLRSVGCFGHDNPNLSRDVSLMPLHRIVPRMS